jgi:hypothetical protein
MLVMIRAFPYLILDILRNIHQNTLLPYLMFFMYLILPSHCFLFRNFINNVHFEFHESMFYVKDLNIKTVLLSSQSNDGLYVMSECSSTSISQAYWSLYAYAFIDIWHLPSGPKIVIILMSCIKS